MSGHGRPGRPRGGRRAFLAATLGLGGLLALGGCGREAPRRWSGRFLTVATTGGALRQTFWAALFAPFGAATGCRVLDVSLPVTELVRELRRQVLVGLPEWDVVALDAPRLAALTAERPGLVARVDDPRLARAAEPADGYGVPILTDTLGLACRTGPFAGRVPAGWAAAWDAAGDFPGPRAFPRDPVGTLEIALLADGVAADQLYPLDVPRALAALERLRPAIRLWWDKPDRGTDALTLGEVDLLLAPGGELRAALDAGATARRALLPAPRLTLALAMPPGAPNADVAADFIAAAFQPPAQAAFARAGLTPLGQEPPAPAFALDASWWRDHGAAAFDQFAAWVNQ